MVFKPSVGLIIKLYIKNIAPVDTDINYVPETLPHREKELSLLSRLFLTLITNPNSLSRNVLITGKTGIGKTVTIKLFALMLENVASKRNILIKYVHVNCRKEKTRYKVLVRIIRSIKRNFPKRGYSQQDLLEIILELLSRLNSHLLIVLDELNYLINKEGDLIYSLTRINDDVVNAPQRLSIIGIIRDVSCLNNLDSSTLSTLQKNIVKFNEYSTEQIFDILKYRAELSLKNNAISDDLIQMISEIVFKDGDIRYGLNILWRASKIAENRDLNHITTECIRLGIEDMVPFATQDILLYMSIHKLIFLLSIIKKLRTTGKPQIFLSEALNSYNSLCENLESSPRSYSQLWNYLQEFKREDFLSISVKSENLVGRKALIEIQNISLQKFEKLIINILKTKEIRI